MKKVFLIPICATLALGACSSDNTTESQPSTTEQGAVAGPLPEPANAPAQTSTTTTTTTSTASATPPSSTPQASSPPPSAAPQPATDYPKGIPVAGKKGYVLSPYAQYAGLVDVNGFPSGTVVSCPYTHKKFVVP